MGFQASLKKFLVLSVVTSSLPSHSVALSLDGEGHYSLRGETRTNPGASGKRGIHQALDQSFRLLGEARVNDKSSFFLELSIFDDPQNAYLGDKAKLKAGCTTGSEEGCDGQHQSVMEPRYEPYAPKITKAYGRYAFDWCILEAGRRGRQWGMGAFLDSGEDPFAIDASVFDGISCDINLQKSQTLGISFGFDKISETGTYVRHSLQSDKDFGFGPANKSDDVNQFFLTIMYDDRKSNAGSSLTKQIGFYGARLNSASLDDGGNNTELTFVDLYTGFFFSNLALKNEILLTLGKTADPNLTGLGGAYEANGEPATNKMNTIGFAGELAWTLASSGRYIGPEIYRQGNATRHQLLVNYAYAPGDADGYYSDNRALEADDALADAKYQAMNVGKRSSKAEALAFHKNFKPNLLMFNGRSQIDDLAVDGIFDPTRVMNAQVYSLGYRYEDLSLGNFEAKASYGFLNNSLSDADIKAYYEANTSETRPFGFYGNDLGYEIDIKYWTNFGKDVDVGIAGAALLPGKAWQIEEESDPENSFLVQSYISFNF
ncbi:MAG: hypothetical protein AB8G05_04575 [Oligoflexales bacterium]